MNDVDVIVGQQSQIEALQKLLKETERRLKAAEDVCFYAQLLSSYSGPTLDWTDLDKALVKWNKIVLK